jgi:hypothetical protein
LALIVATTRLNVARDHADIDHAVQGVGQPLARAAGLDVDLDLGMELAEFFGPFDGHGIEGPSAGEADFPMQGGRGGLRKEEARCGSHSEKDGEEDDQGFGHLQPP